MAVICVIGASTGWLPTLATDLMSVFDEPLEIRLVDINPKALQLCAEWGQAVRRHFRHEHRFVPYTDRREALRGADGVIITIATGGLDAMEQDLLIPEKYGIYATVGDTSGPGSWSRALRNVPVFRRFAEDFQEICPRAIIANYTNPMAILTATLRTCCDNPVVGLCHAYFETKDVIQKIFGLKDWSPISISVAGMNHFTWVVDFRIGREDGYRLLREKIGAGSIRDLLPKESRDEINIWSGHELCAEMYDAFGYLPYPADRHISEFVSYALAGNPERYRMDSRKASGDQYDTVRYCNIKRTTVADRRKSLAGRDERLARFVREEQAAAGRGETGRKPHRSRETGAEMIHAYLHNKPFTDAANALNVGQIPGLPLNACVETLCVVDGLGVRPLMVPNVPEHLLEIMRPAALCQKWLAEGILRDNADLRLQSLYRDPLCAHLKPHEVRRMASELVEANRPFLAEV